MKKPAPAQGRYVLTKSRHIDGSFVPASPDFPAVIEVPAGYPVDDGMVPIEKFQRATHLKPHYVPRRGGHTPEPEAPAASPVTVIAIGPDAVNPSLLNPTEPAPPPAPDDRAKGGKPARG